MSDSSFSEIEQKKTADENDKIELKCILPDGVSIHREYSVTETLKDVLDDIWDSGVEDEIWEEYVIEVDELCSSDEEPDPEEIESSDSENSDSEDSKSEILHDEEVLPILNSMFNPYHNTLATLTGRPYVPSSPEPPPSPVQEKLFRRVKKADIRLRAVTRSNFKIKEFKNDDMALQIQSLDLFENLVRVSFAETNDENNDREAQESTINQIIGNKQMSDYNKYVVDYSFEDELLDEKTTLCERLNDPYYSLNMMRQHLHYFCEKEKSQLRDDDHKNPLCGWNRDFGARKVQNVIQAQYFTKSWCNQKDNEQVYVDARIYLRHWSEDMREEEAKLSFELTIKFSRFVGTPEERPTTVLDLLEDVNNSPFYKRNVELQRYLPVRNGLDFFIVAGKMEILLPLTEKVRNFTSIQNGKFEQVDLFLCRGLDRMVPSYFPWNPGNMYNDNLTSNNIVLDVPYEKSILQKSKLSKYKHALAMRIMTTQDIPYNVAHEVFYKVAVVTGRKVLASQLDQNFGQTTLASFLKPYFRFKNLIFADLPQATLISISFFVRQIGPGPTKSAAPTLGGFTNFKLFNQYGVCHVRETFDIKLNRLAEENIPADYLAKAFVKDNEGALFFIGNVGESPSEISVRISLDDQRLKEQRVRELVYHCNEEDAPPCMRRNSLIVDEPEDPEVKHSLKETHDTSAASSATLESRDVLSESTNNALKAERETHLIQIRKTLGIIDSSIGPFSVNVDKQKTSQTEAILREIRESRLLQEEIIKSMPHQIHKYIQAFSSAEHSKELYKALDRWNLTKLSPETFLPLLTQDFIDPIVRCWAIMQLDKYSDAQLEELLLQIVHLLKYEPYHDITLNPFNGRTTIGRMNLPRFLLQRSMRNRRFAHFLYWHLRRECEKLYANELGSEVGTPYIANSHQLERFYFTVIMECLLKFGGQYCYNPHRDEKTPELVRSHLYKQTRFWNQLITLHNENMHYPDAIERIRNALTENTEFKKSDWECLVNPLEPEMLLVTLNMNKMKMFSSARKPILLPWANGSLIFKEGDDLRQDVLGLQIIRCMDTAWKSRRSHRNKKPERSNIILDLNMTTYQVLATPKCITKDFSLEGFRQYGFIQMVPGETLSSINETYGKTMGYIRSGTFGMKEFLDGMSVKNPEHRHNRVTNEHLYWAFMNSLAGSTVATFVIGIRDRHNDNIMIGLQGEIFHIDYGHILDHRKKKLGYDREPHEFILTTDFVKVFAHGPDKELIRKIFLEKCIWAYERVLERRHDLKLRFLMLVNADLPELKYADLQYLDQKLGYDMSEHDEPGHKWEQNKEVLVAAFRKKMNEYMSNRGMRLIMNFIAHDVRKKIKQTLKI